MGDTPYSSTTPVGSCVRRRNNLTGLCRAGEGKVLLMFVRVHQGRLNPAILCESRLVDSD